MEVRMPIKEIMTRNVATVDIKKSNVLEVANKMLEIDVGSIIVTDKNNPVGIITERDIVSKIVSKNIKPSEISLKELMTTPLITISSTEDVANAMYRMVKLNIKKLPVVENGQLVGIVTDMDLIAISAEMGNIFSDLIKMNREPMLSHPSESMLRGICEECGDNVDTLLQINGKLLCESCREF